MRASFTSSIEKARLSKMGTVTLVKGDDCSSVTASNVLYDEPIIYGTTWIAWLHVVNIMLVNGASSLMWASASSAPIAVSEWMQVDYTALNWLSNLSAVINTLCSLITGWSYQRFGVKANVIVKIIRQNHEFNYFVGLICRSNEFHRLLDSMHSNHCP